MEIVGMRSSFSLLWKLIPAILVIAATTAMALRTAGRFDSTSVSGAALLLLPDDASEQEEHAAAWLQAANEEGIALQTAHDSQLLVPHWSEQASPSAILVPDGIHARASDMLVERLADYARSGGVLLVAHDALSKRPNGIYAQRSALVAALGIRHILYDELKDRSLGRDAARIEAAGLLALHLPPGTYSSPDWETPGMPASEHALTGYQSTRKTYDHFVTQGSYAGQVLLRGSDGSLLAGIHRVGSGAVVLANLPLGYLRNRTDGLLLHSFLRLINDRILESPSLLPVPDGIGGLVMNLHVDSNAALAPLDHLRAQGFFSQGPYSVHVTAGPDTREPGDGLGFDVRPQAKDPRARRWVRYFVERGDAVGSHGGWIHDYFGKQVTSENGGAFTKYLELNHSALSEATGLPVREFSAPIGNHPEWITQWLGSKHYAGFYSTGNIGMGPTEAGQGLWSFPVATYGEAASLEEAFEQRIPDTHVSAWLRALTEHVAAERQARLIYFHPPGLMRYPNAIREWLRLTADKSHAGEFRWYTLGALADFMSRRSQASWDERISEHGTLSTISVHSGASLQGLTWQLPRSRYRRPELLTGKALVREMPEVWLVSSDGDARSLSFRAMVRTAPFAPWLLSQSQTTRASAEVRHE
jgi:hypothetical protein